MGKITKLFYANIQYFILNKELDQNCIIKFVIFIFSMSIMNFLVPGFFYVFINYGKCITIYKRNEKNQANLLDFLDSDNDIEENFNKLCILLDDFKIKKNQHKLTTLLHLIVKIYNNHYHRPYFFQ